MEKHEKNVYKIKTNRGSTRELNCNRAHTNRKAVVNSQILPHLFYVDVYTICVCVCVCVKIN